jgi:hypothetical protein
MVVPPEAHGRLAVLITLVWCGELDAGERVVDRFRRLAPPIADLVQPRPYPDMYQLIPDVPQAGVPQLEAGSGHVGRRTCWSAGRGRSKESLSLVM